MLRKVILGTLLTLGATSAVHAESAAQRVPMSRLPRENGVVPASQLPRDESGWRLVLTDEQYNILRKKGTERAFSNKYHDHKQKGVYRCAACGQPLFTSSAKFDSGTGWPSFYAPASADSVRTKKDRAWFMERTEVVCSRCGGHLGHVFEDGPPPTGLRYCMNSAALEFEPAAASVVPAAASKR